MTEYSAIIGSMEARHAKIRWVLRIGVAMEFAGHGLLALGGKPSWIPLITALGFSTETAKTMLPLVGGLDVFVACLILMRPIRAALLMMTLWGLFTALLRPIAGASILEFVERGPNFAAPFALLLLVGWPVSRRDWIR